jgi:hypothetical protein
MGDSNWTVVKSGLHTRCDLCPVSTASNQPDSDLGALLEFRACAPVDSLPYSKRMAHLLVCSMQVNDSTGQLAVVAARGWALEAAVLHGRHDPQCGQSYRATLTAQSASQALHSKRGSHLQIPRLAELLLKEVFDFDCPRMQLGRTLKRTKSPDKPGSMSARVGQ